MAKDRTAAQDRVPEPCEPPTVAPPKPADVRRAVTAVMDDRPPLDSVGIVCVCGKALASIEGAARTCGCGRIWLVTALQIRGPQ